MRETSRSGPDTVTRVLGIALFIPLLAAAVLVSSFFSAAPVRQPMLAWSMLGALLGASVLMFFFLLRYRSLFVQMAALVIAICVALGSGYFFYKRALIGPTILYERLRVALEIKDTEGKEAHLTQEDQLVVLRNGLSDFWQNDVGAPGETVRNFQVRYSGVDLVSQETREKGRGLYDVRTVVSPALEYGSRVVRTMEFDVLAKPSQEDGHILAIGAITQYAEVVLAMPRGRPCKQASLLVNGQRTPSEISPEIADEGYRVIWRKPNPKLGSEYTVLCSH